MGWLAQAAPRGRPWCRRHPPLGLPCR